MIRSFNIGTICQEQCEPKIKFFCVFVHKREYFSLSKSTMLNNKGKVGMSVPF